MLALTAVFTVNAQETSEYGRNLTQYMSTPKFGGYFIGSYKANDDEEKNYGDGFNARLVRAYVDGSVLTDFKYRIQVELNKSVHLKDVFIEWTKYPEFRVKFGQYKRIFTFEDPYNPWDVGVGDYSQLVKQLSGFSDYTAKEFNGSNGGRDIGLQFQGDFLPVSSDNHKLIHYQVGVFNGQGINVADADKYKDFMGTIQVQPLKDWYIGVFGWKGKYTANGITTDRNRLAFGTKYEHNGWTVRAEYGNHSGQKISDYEINSLGEQELLPTASNGKADAWYATVGVPVTDWFKCYVKWDAYRIDKTNDNMKNIYSVCTNFQLHKNLMFQLQYNLVDDKLGATDKTYNEFWVQTYIRF